MSSDIFLLSFTIGLCLMSGVLFSTVESHRKTLGFIAGAFAMASFIYGPFIIVIVLGVESLLVLLLLCLVTVAMAVLPMYGLYLLEQRDIKRLRLANEQRLAQLLQDNK